jgi:hypothetical protein
MVVGVALATAVGLPCSLWRASWHCLDLAVPMKGQACSGLVTHRRLLRPSSLLCVKLLFELNNTHSAVPPTFSALVVTQALLPVLPCPLLLPPPPLLAFPQHWSLDWLCIHTRASRTRCSVDKRLKKGLNAVPETS